MLYFLISMLVMLVLLDRATRIGRLELLLIESRFKWVEQRGARVEMAKTIAETAEKIISENCDLNKVVHDLQSLEDDITSALLTVAREQREKDATEALEQRCERDTAWDMACIAIAQKIRTQETSKVGE